MSQLIDTPSPKPDPESGFHPGFHPGRTIIVMGVSGCGKSTIARHLAELLQVPFLDGDQLHPPTNIALMSAGKPLTDADREPWLRAVRDYAANAVKEGTDCVIACSALKRSYRRLLNTAGEVFYVFLDGSRTLIASRMQEREGHFMPAELLDSQFAALERPVSEANVVTVDVAPAPLEIAEAARQALIIHPAFT